jgi:2-methylcitrate dehydratase PrpD
MSTLFLQRTLDLIEQTQPQPADALPFVRLAFEDTLAVGFAGWAEPVVRGIANVVPGGLKLKPAGTQTTSATDTALMLGTASHALDYDDVHLTSSTHPSVPIVAALVAARNMLPAQAARLSSAFAIGIGLNIGLGKVLGYSHYEKGWHATSTMGPLAAAAACAYYFGLNRQQSAYALAMAAATAGGLQRNFGTMAKPLQAGLAAEAGLRAALLAQAGVTADPDIFAPKGYFDLYSGARPGVNADEVTLDTAGEGICMKLFPCCYATHRPAGAALDARRTLEKQGVPLERLADIEILGDKGVFIPLRVTDPKTGNDGKFCGAYVVACALIDGSVGLAHFTDQAVHRQDVRALMPKIRLVERHNTTPAAIRGGPLELIGKDANGSVVVHTVRDAFPGAPDDPPSLKQRRAKVQDCMAHYSRTTGQAFTYRRFQSYLDKLFAQEEAKVSKMASDD